MERIAAFSDIHSNLRSLQAVLADIERQHPGRVCYLGDPVGYVAYPNEVIEAIHSRGIPTVIWATTTMEWGTTRTTAAVLHRPGDAPPGRYRSDVDHGARNTRGQGLPALPASLPPSIAYPTTSPRPRLPSGPAGCRGISLNCW